ncbi:MAG: hypothetical protein NVS2B11_05500 [Acetobacteraceae bacterium]
MSAWYQRNLHRYGPGWKAGRGPALAAAGFRCEAILPDGTRCPKREGDAIPGKVGRVVLTRSHKDHTPENVAPHNLAVLCQRCHHALDAGPRRDRRRARLANADLFNGVGP